MSYFHHHLVRLYIAPVLKTSGKFLKNKVCSLHCITTGGMDSIIFKLYHITKPSTFFLSWPLILSVLSFCCIFYCWLTQLMHLAMVLTSQALTYSRSPGPSQTYIQKECPPPGGDSCPSFSYAYMRGAWG